MFNVFVLFIPTVKAFLGEKTKNVAVREKEIVTNRLKTDERINMAENSFRIFV
jgi:hypothetical protein